MVRNAEWGMRNADFGMRISEWGLRIADYGVRILEWTPTPRSDHSVSGVGGCVGAGSVRLSGDKLLVLPVVKNEKRRAPTRWACLLVLASIAATATAQEPDLGTEAQRAAGETLYLEKCAQCHGETGDADAVATALLRPEPRDFTSGIFKFRTTRSGELPTTEDLERSIRDGMAYTSMPAWGGILSETEITNLAYYIKTFNDDFSGSYGIPEEVEIPDAPGFDEEKLARGRIVYEENQCADCHGDQGRGDGPSAPTLEDQWGQPIRAADLTTRWTFRNGAAREDIYRTFTTGLDGSPMPSYDIPEEDRWALVDYIYALSRDEPDYGTVVVARGVEGDLDITQGKALFDDAPAAYFPLVGQVIEPGRAFHPAVNGVEVRAVYTADEIAFLLVWHDMTAETSGRNAPDLPAEDAGMQLVAASDVPGDTSEAAESASGYSDAVALQFPADEPAGQTLPYFLFGDRKNAVELWFADLAADAPTAYLGHGSGALETADVGLEGYSRFEDGEWTAVFKRARAREGGLAFDEAAFLPVAFSVWDGFTGERGNQRAVSSWYYTYLEPMERPAVLVPMLTYGGLVLLGELLLIGLVRWTHRRRQRAVLA